MADSISLTEAAKLSNNKLFTGKKGKRNGKKSKIGKR